MVFETLVIYQQSHYHVTQCYKITSHIIYYSWYTLNVCRQFVKQKHPWKLLYLHDEVWKLPSTNLMILVNKDVQNGKWSYPTSCLAVTLANPASLAICLTSLLWRWPTRKSLATQWYSIPINSYDILKDYLIPYDWRSTDNHINFYKESSC